MPVAPTYPGVYIFSATAAPARGCQPGTLANVTAKYHKGIGVAGQVKADQLSQLMSRPLGVKGVTNPLNASGAQDAEKIEEARRHAPLAILTLGRIVSLQDYEDFARAFLGVGKAKATWTWSGENRGVFLTIGDDPGSLHERLPAAVPRAGTETVEPAELLILDAAPVSLGMLP